MDIPRVFRIAALALTAALPLTGCGEDSVSVEIPAGHGAAAFYVTDGPLDLTEVTNLYVTFDRLLVFPAGDSLPDSTGSRRPIEVMASPTTVDLLSLTGGLTAALGAANLPEGDYRGLLLELDPDGAWLIEADGDTHDVEVRGHWLVIRTEFSVEDGELSEIVLDFDAAASLFQDASGRYFLRPVVGQVPNRPDAASISGAVFVQTDSGLVPAGEVLVPNPRFGRRGQDEGHGRRPGDDRGHSRPRDDRALVPLTVAWPMIVHAAVAGNDDTGDDDSGDGAAGAELSALDDTLPGRDPRRAWSRGTVVGPGGRYVLWRLRKDVAYTIRLFVHPRSGFEVLSAPDPIALTGDVSGADFVLVRRSDGS